MMIRSLWSGATGMKAMQFHIDAIAHDLTNVNTNGYKKKIVNFHDLMYQTTRASGLQGGTDGTVNLPVGVQEREGHIHVEDVFAGVGVEFDAVQLEVQRVILARPEAPVRSRREVPEAPRLRHKSRAPHPEPPLRLQHRQRRFQIVRAVLVPEQREVQ